MPTYQEQMREVERRRRIAEALQAGGSAPQGQMAGRFYAAPSNTANIARLAAILGGRFMGKRADRDEKAARSGEQERLAEAFARMTGGGDQGVDGAATPPDPRMQAARDVIGGLPLETQQQALGGKALETLFPKPKESPFAKVNPKDFTPESVAKFNQSGNPSDLMPREQETEAVRTLRALSSDPNLAALDEKRRRAGATNVDARNMGNIPPGFQLVRDPQGNPLRMEPIPGGPAAQEAAAAEKAAAARRSAEVDRGGILTQEIDRVLKRMDTGILPDTGMGAALKDVPGTDAKAISALLETVKANIGFEQLNQMRAQSPTGGALGNVTEKEIRFLQAVAGSLDQSQDNQQLRDNLNRLWNSYQDIIHGPGQGPQRRPLSFEQGDEHGTQPSGLPDGWSVEVLQ